MGNYSWGAYSTLPTDDADLSNILDAAALSQIASDDTVRLAQPADGMISIIQFKDTITAGSATVRWNGQSNVAPSTAAVNLEIYNRSGTPTWESLASDNTTSADIDFTLSSYISDLTDYKNVNDIACRVYQAATAPGISWNHRWLGNTADGNDYGTGTALNLTAHVEGLEYVAGYGSTVNAVDFGGSNWLTSSGTNPDVHNPATAPFSVRVIVKPATDITSVAFIAGTLDFTNRDTASGWLITIGSSKFRVVLSAGAGAQFFDSGTISASTYYHVIYTQDSTSGVIYVNGSATSGTVLVPGSTTYAFYSGYQMQDGAILDHIDILNGTALTQEQVTADYNAWV